MNTQPITIALAGNEQGQIAAYVYRGLALHRSLDNDKYWMLTHVASGYSVLASGQCKQMSERDAFAWLQFAAGLTDWTAPFDAAFHSSVICETLPAIVAWKPGRRGAA